MLGLDRLLRRRAEKLHPTSNSCLMLGAEPESVSPRAVEVSGQNGMLKQMFEKGAEILYRELSEDNALAHAHKIYGYERRYSFDNFHKSARYCAESLRARLEVVPGPGIPGKVLADYRENPFCVAMWSPPTKPGGVEAEAVLKRRPDFVLCDNEKCEFCTWGKEQIRRKYRSRP